jgi:hypothetical protein
VLNARRRGVGEGHPGAGHSCTTTIVPMLNDRFGMDFKQADRHPPW